jgi:hypothetical protein
VEFAGCSLVADLGQFDHVVAASSDAAGTPSDASQSADDGSTIDESTASTDDAGSDAVAESSAYANVDATVDSAVDAAPDSHVSPPTADGSLDATIDSTVDAAVDSPVDVTVYSPVDATPDSQTSPPVDASPDTAIGDSAMPVDASPEASTWCAMNATTNTFDCHDFDESSDAAAGFTNHLLSTWGELATVTSTDYAPSSAPSSLLISTPALDGGGYAIEQFNDVLLYHNKFELSFATKIVNYDSDAGVVSLIRMSYQNNGWAETLDLRGATTALNESWTNNGKAAHTATMLPLNAWVNVDLVVDLNGHTQTLTYNGISALTASAISNPNESNPALFVQAGLNYLGGPALPMSIYCDNIIVNTPP